MLKIFLLGCHVKIKLYLDELYFYINYISLKIKIYLFYDIFCKKMHKTWVDLKMSLLSVLKDMKQKISYDSLFEYRFCENENKLYFVKMNKINAFLYF